MVLVLFNCITHLAFWILLYISLLIIPCIIEYVTNEQTLNLGDLLKQTPILFKIKTQILSTFTHPFVIPKPYDVLSSLEIE